MGKLGPSVNQVFFKGLQCKHLCETPPLPLLLNNTNAKYCLTAWASVVRATLNTLRSGPPNRLQFAASGWGSRKRTYTFLPWRPGCSQHTGVCSQLVCWFLSCCRCLSGTVSWKRLCNRFRPPGQLFSSNQILIKCVLLWRGQGRINWVRKDRTPHAEGVRPISGHQGRSSGSPSNCLNLQTLDLWLPWEGKLTYLPLQTGRTQAARVRQCCDGQKHWRGPNVAKALDHHLHWGLILFLCCLLRNSKTSVTQLVPFITVPLSVKGEFEITVWNGHTAPTVK